METMYGLKKISKWSQNGRNLCLWPEALKYPIANEPLGTISPSIKYSCLLQDYTSRTLFRVNTQNMLKRQVIRDKT